ncbi:DsbA family protein [Microbacterium sp. LRZ72]|uniref:DsbA family protein n=1 Tax=Microbacterium sp. LRZ72 TaxID=2942481 RepID=UPI0029B9B41A|nr:thioredoxin domain-containing protein [Microbacterium sp. LRZ72]MDX2376605.1 DsbA family protein [Microbacterium sp. LRZ72]
MAAGAGKKNWFAIWMSVAVVVVLVGAGAVVVWMNNQASAPGPAPDAAIVNEETGAIAVGDGETVVATYIDFMCPICNQFEEIYGETLNELVADDSITLEYHPVAILDNVSQGTEYSTRAANALYCVAESSPEAVTPFVQAMYANQPAEGSAGLTDEQIIEIAETAGATGVTECIEGGTYERYVATQTANMPADETGARGTPTVLVDGERLTLTGDPQIDIVDRLP